MRTTRKRLGEPDLTWLSPGTSSHSAVDSTRGPRMGGPDTTTQPPGCTKRVAKGTKAPVFPAQRMTTASNRPANRVTTSSARAFTTSTPESPSSRTAVERKDARRWRASINTTVVSGRTTLMGTPGNPAPAPRSASASNRPGRARRNRRLSRKRFSTIQSGRLLPTSRAVLCHLSNISRYLQNWSDSRAVRGRPSSSVAPSARVTRGSVIWRGRLPPDS